MIRVLHYGLDSKLGGIETYLYKLYKHIDKSKFKFDFLIIGDEKPCYYDEFKKMGSRFYRITPRSKNPFKNKKDLEVLLEKEKFDIIHCHLNTLSYIQPVKVAIKRNIPVIVHSRNAGASKSVISNLLHKINSKFISKEEITKLAVSDLAGKWLFGDESKYTIINNGLDVNKYKFDENKRKKIRDEFNLEEELLIAHIGAMRPQKNHMFLLEIFRKFLDEDNNAKLVLVGDGKLKDSIIEKINDLKINDNVIIAGKREDINSILCGADIFLFPSFFEGFPNAVLEAQTSGLPCLISSEITEEVIINDDCHVMDLSKNSDLWSQKLKSIKLNNNRVKSYMDIKTKGFCVDTEIEKINNIYNGLCCKTH